MSTQRERMFREVVCAVERKGYPEALGTGIAGILRTEMALSRMLRYLDHSGPLSAEEITDEALAISEQRDDWVRKKRAEYYNVNYSRINSQACACPVVTDDRLPPLA